MLSKKGAKDLRQIILAEMDAAGATGLREDVLLDAASKRLGNITQGQLRRQTGRLIDLGYEIITSDPDLPGRRYRLVVRAH